MVAEVRSGVETIDHIAIPVRDLEKNQSFYCHVLELNLKTSRKNPDGNSRQTHVVAGKNIIALHLPGISAGISESAGPRIGIGVSAAHFERVQGNLAKANHAFHGPVAHGEEAPIERSIYFDDPDGNHLEFCVRRKQPLTECISHTVFETRDLRKAITFYSETLGTGAPLACGDEVFVPVQNGQMIGFVEVKELSERSKKHGRGCHMAMNVTQDDFDSMVALVERYGGKTQGDGHVENGLRPAGERRGFFFDPDNNRLQIIAPVAHKNDQPLDEQEKWRRIVTARKQTRRGLTPWEGSGKKFL